MNAFNVYKNLSWLNDLPVEQAENILLGCSGSGLWASQMTTMRPFRMLEDLYGAADAIWFSLPPAEWIAAFGSVNKKQQRIVSLTADPGRGQALKNDIQADPDFSAELNDLSRLYQEKFGFIFVVDVTAESSPELLAIAKARLKNSVKTELQIAAEEHRKIIERELNRILEQ